MVLRRPPRRRRRPHRPAARRTGWRVLERIAPAYRIAGEVTADPAVAERVADEALAAGHEGVDGQGASTRPTPRDAGASTGSRSSRCTPTTSSCSASSGARAGARAGCPTCTSAPATPRASSAAGLRHGGQDVQGTHRRAAALADRDLPRARASTTTGGCSRATRGRRRDRASTGCSGRPAIPAGSRCGSRGSSATATKGRRAADAALHAKPVAEADTIQSLRALLR